MRSSLAASLFREVRPDFFRVLSGQLARLYVDALDTLEREAARSNHGMDREEALALIEQVVEAHGDLPHTENEALAQASTIREKSRAVFDYLKHAGWLTEDDARSDYQKIVFFDSNGVVVMQSLRKIAFPDAAIFSDKVINVCTTLANYDALVQEPWAQVESCVATLQAGLTELRGMQKSIERHTRQQLAAGTLKENLAVMFDQFAERIGRTCYAQLVHARLPSRLADAKQTVNDQLTQADLQTKMQTEMMRREPALSPEAAMARVRLRLDELAELLEQVEPLADVIDRRTAEFARRSQARFRYLQETTSENRGRIQLFFETLNQHFAGQRLTALDELNIEFPILLLHDAKLIGGMESLYTPHLRRVGGEIEPMEDSDPRQQDRALAELEGTMRDSLTVNRANRFIAALPGESDARFNSVDLLREHVHNDENVADLIACLLHARSSDAKFRVDVPRAVSEADAGEFDSKLGYRIERFTLVKK
ncbi:MAG: Wadjet anti-phage system protein JetA family protein [Verrucomicrobiota bacterium]